MRFTRNDEEADSKQPEGQLLVSVELSQSLCELVVGAGCQLLTTDCCPLFAVY